MKTYKEVVDYIYSIPKFTKKNTYKDTKEFYEFLRKPGSNQKIIHVSGTNGKGSVCAYMNQIFVESGHLVGMFTSPHLVCIEERIQLNGKQIEKIKFVELFQEIFNAIETYRQSKPTYYPTFFELLFFMAMLYFEEQQVEVVILETGLGGRLDATNVIVKPMICVITKIGLDHTEYLGNSIIEIATEKAGIIKKNVPVVYWSENAIVNSAIIKKSELNSAILYPINMNEVIIVKNKDKNIDFSYNSSYYKNMSFKLGNSALYQVENALLALTVFEVIREEIFVEKQIIKEGLQKTKWPGRMEEVLPNVYLDGAHNVDGIKAMLRGISFKKGEKNILLFSAVKDKSYQDMIIELTKKKEFFMICITKIPGERGIEIEKMEKEFKKHTTSKIVVLEDVKEAYIHCEECINKQKVTGALYVLGSLYLVGLVKEVLDERQKDSEESE